jgi:hypothetical protein
MLKLAYVDKNEKYCRNDLLISNNDESTTSQLLLALTNI